MDQINQHNIHDAARSLAKSIRKKLVEPSEQKFTSIVNETKKDIDNRTNNTEELIHRHINELNQKLETIQKTQKWMGVFCLTLCMAFLVNIVIQLT